MLEIGSYRVDGYKEKLLYVVCFVSSLYFLFNGLVPSILGIDQFIWIPRTLEIPLIVIGGLSLTVIVTTGIIIVGASFMERNQNRKDFSSKPLLDLIASDSELLAPNISDEIRQIIISQVHNQSENGIIQSALAIIDKGEEACQIALLLSKSPKTLESTWDEISDGVRVLSITKLKSIYNINSKVGALEVVWD